MLLMWPILIMIARLLQATRRKSDDHNSYKLSLLHAFRNHGMLREEFLDQEKLRETPPPTAAATAAVEE